MRRRLTLPLLLSLLLTAAAAAQDGPGIGNLTYASSERWNSIARIDGATGTPNGHGFVTMHRGYLLVIFSADAGGGNGTGGFAFLDVSDPRRPQPVFTTHGNPDYARGTPHDAGDIREAHGFSISNDVLCLATNRGLGTGLQLWDVANPRRPRKVGSLVLPGLSGGDYSPTPWWVCWQGGRYVYVAGTSAGIFIVDAADPRRPRLVDRGAGRANPIPPPQLGIGRVNVVFAVGNLLVAANSDDRGVATFDIGDPANPVLLHASNEKVGYSMMVNGNRIYGGADPATVFDISDPRRIRAAGRGNNVAAKGGYGVVQDEFFHYGSSSKVVKLDTRTLRSVGTAAPGGYVRPDWDFSTPLGNLTYAGNDHGGSALVIHDPQPDRRGPEVNMVVPADGAIDQPLTTRVGLTFTDQVDLRSVDTRTVIVRRRGGLAPLPGRFSHQTGIVNFWPDLPLEANAVYEVLVPAGGVRDLVGNPNAQAFQAVFSTGSVLAQPISCSAQAAPPTAIGQPIMLQAGVVTGAGGAVEYAWDLGDGTRRPFSTDPRVTHTYAAPGHYRVVLEVRSGHQWASSTFSQIAFGAPTPRAPTSSSSLAHDAALGRLWQANPDNGTVSAIELAGLNKLFEAPVGARPRSVAVAPDGTVWVVAQGDDAIRVLDPRDGRTLSTIALPPGSGPFGLAFAPDGRAGYVTLEASGQVAELDPAARLVARAAPVGPWPRGLAVSADGSELLVSRFVSPEDEGQVVRVSTASLQVLERVTLAHDPGPDTEDSGRGVPNYLGAPVISPDGSGAWVPSKKDNTRRGLTRDGQPLSFESTVRAIVSRIELPLAREDLSARVDFNDRDLPRAVAFSPRGDWLFVALQGSNAVEVRDAYQGELALAIEGVGRAPAALVVIGERLFVHCFLSRELRVYDVAQLLDGTARVAPELAVISTVASEALPAPVLRGKQLFYDSSDRRMSLDGYISCASCHLDGGHDGRVWDFSDRGEGLRNTISLLGKRGAEQGPLHWSANFDEVQDFEHDVRAAFGGTGFMSALEFGRGTRSQPLGTTKAGGSPDLDDLAAYLESLDRVGRSPDRASNGALSASGQLGRAVFLREGCADCHSGQDYTDSALGGRHDVGTLASTSGGRLGGALTALDTPSLRGLWATAPYLHDGSAATLRQVLDRSGPRHGDAASLPDAEKDALVAYLRQIDALEPDAPLGPAGVALLEPRDADTVTAGDLAVRYRVSGTPAGVSHVRLQLDGGSWVDDRDLDGRHTLNGVGVGAHQLTIELVDSGGQPVSGPLARQRVAFFVAPALSIEGARTSGIGARSLQVGVLRVGAELYDDRSFTFQSVDRFAGLGYVRTRNRDKGSRRSSFLRFRVAQAVTVYVAFDARAQTLPAWLQTWRDTGVTLRTTDTPRRVYAQAFPAGWVILGGNKAPGAESMYSVIVEPRVTPLSLRDPFASSGRGYVRGTLGVGQPLYTDRAFTFQGVGALDGLPYLRTANDDKRSYTHDFLRFTVDQPVTVYVLFDARAQARPSWLQGWRELPWRVQTSDTERRVYARDFGGGVIALGGNAASGAGSMYSVVVQIQSQRPPW